MDNLRFVCGRVIGLQNQEQMFVPVQINYYKTQGARDEIKRYKLENDDTLYDDMPYIDRHLSFRSELN